MNTKLLFTMAFCLTLLACDDQEEESQLIDEESLEQKYTGTWSSTTPRNVYDKIGASLKIIPEESSNSWVGEFYFTAGYVACCNGGDSNGPVTLIIDENLKITSFKYVDTIPNCAGVFEGTGQITESIMEIYFSGSDCEGEHKDGILTLIRSKL